MPIGAKGGLWTISLSMIWSIHHKRLSLCLIRSHSMWTWTFKMSTIESFFKIQWFNWCPKTKRRTRCMECFCNNAPREDTPGTRNKDYCKQISSNKITTGSCLFLHPGHQQSALVPLVSIRAGNCSLARKCLKIILSIQTGRWKEAQAHPVDWIEMVSEAVT